MFISSFFYAKNIEKMGPGTGLRKRSTPFVSPLCQTASIFIISTKINQGSEKPYTIFGPVTPRYNLYRTNYMVQIQCHIIGSKCHIFRNNGSGRSSGIMLFKEPLFFVHFCVQCILKFKKFRRVHGCTI